jgi:hypothetical protein
MWSGDLTWLVQSGSLGQGFRFARAWQKPGGTIENPPGHWRKEPAAES